MDNTWASPLYFKPFAHGVDVSIQAATKYIVGHADAMLGAITSNARAAKHIERSCGHLGACPGSEETFLGLRGLRTLDVRLERHQKSGIEIARWLQGRPEVARVLHPALPGDPGHALWKRDFSGACGLFSVILKPVSKTAIAAMLDGLELFGMGYSWGGYESLVIPFDPSSYRTATQWKAEGPALRFHIGLEDVEISNGICRRLTGGVQRSRSRSQITTGTHSRSFALPRGVNDDPAHACVNPSVAPDAAGQERNLTPNSEELRHTTRQSTSMRSSRMIEREPAGEVTVVPRLDSPVAFGQSSAAHPSRKFPSPGMAADRTCPRP